MSIGLMFVCAVIGGLIALPFDIKKTKEAIEDDKARSEQWKKELEEQRKREELGRWK